MIYLLENQASITAKNQYWFHDGIRLDHRKGPPKDIQKKIV